VRVCAPAQASLRMMDCAKTVNDRLSYYEAHVAKHLSAMSDDTNGHFGLTHYGVEYDRSTLPRTLGFSFRWAASIRVGRVVYGNKYNL
jgi:hypothetical protein